MSADLSMLKTVIQCRDYERSREFYTSILELRIVEEWDQDEGRGFIVGLGTDSRHGLIEISAVPPQSERFDAAYLSPAANDKILLQIETGSVDRWVEKLAGRWPTDGPIDRPWGQRYLWLRDPDGVRIALYEVLRGTG